MAGVRLVAQTVEVPTGVVKKTLLQILAPTNQKVKVREISVSFDGISNVAEPILVQVEVQTGAGVGGDVLTLKKMNPDDSETVQTTALSDIDGTSSPRSSGTPPKPRYASAHRSCRFPWRWEPTFRAQRPSLLLEGNYADYDVAPDGNKFIVIKRREPESKHINLVLNWFEELKALAVAAGE